MKNTDEVLRHGVPSILFVCTGNTCRSVMAEALARRRFGDRVQVSSAGLKPQKPEDAKNAIETLKFEFDWDASGHVPRDVRTIDLESLDYVVAMDKDVGRELKKLTNRELIIWQIDDPWSDDPDLYRRCALKINQQLDKLPVTKQSWDRSGR